MKKSPKLCQYSDPASIKRRKQVGEQLRQLYEDVASGEVPESLIALLQKADDARSTKR